MREPTHEEMHRDLSAWADAGRPGFRLRDDGGMSIVDLRAACEAFGAALGAMCADAIIESTEAALADAAAAKAPR